MAAGGSCEAAVAAAMGKACGAALAGWYAALAALVWLGVRDVLVAYEENRCGMTYMFEYPEYLVSTAGPMQLGPRGASRPISRPPPAASPALAPNLPGEGAGDHPQGRPRARSRGQPGWAAAAQQGWSLGALGRPTTSFHSGVQLSWAGTILQRVQRHLGEPPGGYCYDLYHY